MEIYEDLAAISECIHWEYKKYRRDGCSRDEAIAKIREDYAEELCDEDDRIGVLAGLVFILCRKKELFNAIADEMRAEIERFKEYSDYSKHALAYCAKIEKKLNNPELYGDEAVYKPISLYKPDWKIGDTFYHTLTYPTAEKLGIMGWSIIFYKVSEYVGIDGVTNQAVCVSLCPPGDLPSSYEDLKKIGFLPLIEKNRPQFLAQIKIKSKKTEEGFELTKIGCFPCTDDFVSDVLKNERPVVSMPLFKRLRKTDIWPDYEELICSTLNCLTKRGCYWPDYEDRICAVYKNLIK